MSPLRERGINCPRLRFGLVDFCVIAARLKKLHDSRRASGRKPDVPDTDPRLCLTRRAHAAPLAQDATEQHVASSRCKGCPMAISLARWYRFILTILLVFGFIPLTG